MKHQVHRFSDFFMGSMYGVLYTLNAVTDS